MQYQMPDDAWFSQCFVLDALLPLGVIVSIILHDLIPAPPSKLSTGVYDFRSLFRNFLTLEDLEDAIPDQRGISPPVWKIRVLVSLAAVESFAWFGYFAYALSTAQSMSAISALVASVTWIYAAARVSMMQPRTPPYFLIMFYGLTCVASSVDLISQVRHGRPSITLIVADVFRLATPSVLIWISGSLPLQAMPPASNVASVNDTPSNKLSNPEDSVNLWSWCDFSFIEPLFHVATSRRLDDIDVWTLSPYFRHKNLFEKFLKYQDDHPSHSLLHFLLASNSLDLILDVSLETWSAIVGFVPPYCLQRILASLADPSPESISVAYNFAFLTFLAHLSFAQFALFKGWHTRRCYERTRGQLFCALHYKALKRQDISGKITQEDDDSGNADLGKVVNLMQGDAYAVAQRFWEFSAFFLAPVRLIIALVFLFQVLGWSSLAGVVVVLVAYILNYPLAKYNLYITRASWKAKDRRMNGVNELFQNVRFLKFYGWENYWAGKVRDYRDTELRWRVKENVVATLISFIWTWIPSATALLSFLCYTLIAQQQLTVSKAFTAIALFTQLQEPMTALPGQVFALLHAYVSMQRIEEFLSEKEVPDWASSLKSPSLVRRTEEIGFENAVFVWHSSLGAMTTRFQLGPLNVSLPRGELTLVTGPTGCGKTAFLTALLGEMEHLSGGVAIDKSNHQVAYCAQNPWLEHATIRENIIFGSPFGYDEARYDTVIDACALGRDLEVLDAGDLTEIGEKGVTLSGGQRARVALARALYSQASCLLLDDPLAAVDMHTAQHIVDNCLMSELTRGRTVILVTHHISLCLPIASYVVQLLSGQVERQGSAEDFRGVGPERIDDDAVEDTSPAASLPGNEVDATLGDRVKWRRSQVSASGGKLVEVETRAEGRVSLKTYLIYIRAAGWFSWILTIVLMIAIRFITIGNQFFLAKWGEAYNQPGSSSIVLAAFVPVDFMVPRSVWDQLPSPAIDVKPWLLVYFHISLVGAFAVLAYISLGYYASLQASRSLFWSMLERLIKAPSRWFDVTPAGRILNRFTSDINIVDGALQNSSRAALSGCLNFIASFCVVIFVVPGFAPFAMVIAWLYIRLSPRYIQASRDLRRLESISLSPAFAAFDELLRGLAHIRAFGMERRYQDAFYKRVDKFQNFDHVYWLVSGWLRWRYDCLGSVVVFTATIAALWSGVSNGSAALVIVQAGVFAEASRQLVRVAAQLELDFNSVERIVEYLGVPQEAPSIIAEKRPPAYWPSDTGHLVVQKLVVRYAPDLPPAIDGISFTVRPGEKVGVVGRTGSGKSTLALSFLRMIEPSGGEIIIDGIDISTIGLEDLRTRITIVSQDVSLFSGTIRSNLDPFGEHSDAEMWQVLERCHLIDRLGARSAQPHSHERTAAITLDTPVSQSGSLSAGERQLVALARAVLRRTNIVIMDEATSQIDMEIDDKIQRTIREELSSAVVITIAHRLKTIVDYDRILVLGGGVILEFDTPGRLLSKPGGAFREMCRRSADWHSLRSSAESSDSM